MSAGELKWRSMGGFEVLLCTLKLQTPNEAPLTMKSDCRPLCYKDVLPLLENIAAS